MLVAVVPSVLEEVPRLLGFVIVAVWIVWAVCALYLALDIYERKERCDE